MLSKALDTSKRTAVNFFLSIALSISLVVQITEVSVECHCLFPLCLDERRSLDDKYEVN